MIFICLTFDVSQFFFLFLIFFPPFSCLFFSFLFFTLFNFALSASVYSPFLIFPILYFFSSSSSSLYITVHIQLTNWPLTSFLVFYIYFFFFFFFYCRIINVSSTAHLLGNLEAVREKEDLMLSKAGAYEPWPAYGTKLLTILYTLILDHLSYQVIPYLNGKRAISNKTLRLLALANTIQSMTWHDLILSCTDHLFSSPSRRYLTLWYIIQCYYFYENEMVGIVVMMLSNHLIWSK